jgi:amino acid transporter/mannitol/fructose-specific phosphotransferase system IIA component (Ntr-type)
LREDEAVVQISKRRRLKKELGLFDVYAVATGTTLSAGFFLLPGLAAEQAGPALVLAYLLAAVPLIPAMFSVAELATAMPRAGGVYYFLDRSLGPMVGTVGGLGTWMALMLKVAFALVGMGAYIGLFVPNIPITELAVGLAVALGVLNLFGAKKTGHLQTFLVVGLLAILALFVGGGVPRIRWESFSGLFDAGTGAIVSTAGLVYISYVGVTHVASLSEEVRNPERNIPLGIFLALGTAMVIYGLGTAVMVGVVPMDELSGDLTPVASAAGRMVGRWGVVVVSIAALFAFTSVANAGTLSASRYPLAMSRDHLVPRLFRRLSAAQTPYVAIVLTVAAIVAILVFLDPTKIAKLASAFQLLMFALICLAVIVMRESRIESYDPGYRSPLYPWMQIAGIVTPLALIAEMGSLAMLFTSGFAALGIVLYGYYGRRRVSRSGALYHIFARLGQQRLDAGLDPELRVILREKGLREEDPFDEVVAQAAVIDLDEPLAFERLVARVSEVLAGELPATREELERGFLEGTRIGLTPVARGVSLPHLRLFHLDRPHLVMVRSRPGLAVDVTDVHGVHAPEEPIHALFFLVSPEEEPKQHLRILAHIAERVDDEDFMASWLGARNEQVLKEILLQDERYLSLRLRPGTASAAWIGKALGELELPDGVLVALVRRQGRFLVPRGRTVLEENDRLTILGAEEEIGELRSELGQRGA